MNEHTPGPRELPRTAHLDQALRRARIAAEQRSHRHVTLEHLLLVLLDEPEAAKLIQWTAADVAAIHSALSTTVNNRMASLVGPSGRQPSFSYRFETLFKVASQDALEMGRGEIDGAITLIAVAKDAESNASGILSANGFDAESALAALNARADRRRTPHDEALPFGTMRRTASDHPKALDATAPKSTMTLKAVPDPMPPPDQADDVLASVLTLLESEALKEGEEPQKAAYEERVEENKPLFQTGERANALVPNEPKIGPPPGDPLVRQAGSIGAGKGFADSAVPSFDLERDARLERRTPRSALRARGHHQAILTKLFATFPRKVRVGKPQKVQVVLTKDDVGQLFSRSSRRLSQSQAAQSQASSEPCRAVALRLAASGGDISIEAVEPETQWSNEGDGSDVFGCWAWTLTARESGRSSLTVSFSMREIEANRIAPAIALAEQKIKLKVLRDHWAAISRFLRDMTLMLTGGGLAILVLYVIKTLSHGQPHFL